MTISEIMQKMVSFSEGNIHDIDHLIKVWAYARTIGVLEHLDEETQFILEAAAITHDIACPLCREKYGSTNGKYQEEEGMPLVEEFFKGSDLTDQQIGRIKYLVGHHHTLTDISGSDYQMLIEADFIVNASENGYDRDKIENFVQMIAKTPAGINLISEVFRI
ncbi:MAG: HD domain-containing protein [Oscillospiraceae bacterium]|nr:HD domain-containing protein [Oscillospiraceae bacterium]